MVDMNICLEIDLSNGPVKKAVEEIIKGHKASDGGAIYDRETLDKIVDVVIEHLKENKHSAFVSGVWYD